MRALRRGRSLTAPRSRRVPGVIALVALLVASLLAGCELNAAPASPPTGGSPGSPAASEPPEPTASARPSFVRPTPTPVPTFLAHVVAGGETLTSIARRYSTTPRSLAFWNRATYPSLDPDSEGYEPDRIEVGWRLMLIPGVVVDEDELPPPSVAPSPTVPGATFPPGPTPRPDGASLVVSRGSRETPGVALTFDMGGRLDPALDIIDWLVEHDVRATIFPTGNAAANTAIGRQVLERVAAHPELFTVGNHSWDHADFATLDAAAIADQLERTEAAVEDVTGRSTKPFFRAPFGSQDADVRARVGAAGWAYTIMWDVDTIDWRPTADGGPTAADIEAKVLSRAQGGSIVLMHLGGFHTLEALPGIVDGLRGRGLEPVTLSELLGS